MSLTLSKLLGISEHNDVIIHGISSDSRQVKHGYAFVALKGTNSDGLEYIDAAIKAGAKVIVYDEKVDLAYKDPDVIYITSSNTRQSLCEMAARFYPNQPNNIVAVTGTSGKTSVVHFYRMLCYLQKINAASIGTIGVIKNKDELTSYPALTTPDTITLHQLLSQLKAENFEELAFEASSHGLEQYRLDGVNIKAAAFTNLSRDHLDYHHNMEDYLQAKMLIFTRLKTELAVVNADIAEFEFIKNICRQKIYDFGYNAQFAKIISINFNGQNQLLTLEVEGVWHELVIPLIGEFQIYNLLTAFTLYAATHGNYQEVVNLLSQVTSVPGRLERVPANDKLIFVDYAHKPEGLLKAINALKPYVTNRLIVVFGCGGNRDKGKRAIMGDIAAKHADIAIITDDNPRTEIPEQIRKEVLAACPGGMDGGDRRSAIKKAITMMQPGDVLLIAGRGHEKMQIIGTQEIEFDDVKVVKELLG